MLHQSGLFGSPVKGQRRPVPALEEEDEEEYDDSQDVEMSLVSFRSPQLSIKLSRHT